MKAKFSIKQILSDHWDDFTLQYHNKIRTCVISEVRRVLGCGEIDNGFTFYQCPHCGKYRFVPFRCHSRFCNSCGVAYQRSRSESISSKLINCRHRHIVFTIAEELRIYFRRDCRLLDILFKSAAQTISDWLYEMNHSRNFTSGMVCALHTFGRDLKWNPHIHMIVTEGALDCNGIWKHIAFFPYIMLRKRWMTSLLSNMKHSLDPDIFDIHDFKALVNSGFYNGKTFYEAEKDVKILAGDPKEDKSANGQPIEDEFNANLLNLSGAVSMYNEGSNTTGSRFFINTVSAEFFKSTTTRTSLRYSLDGYIKALGEYEAEYKDKYGDEWESYAAKDMHGSAADPRKINDETINLYLQHGGNITYDGELAVYNKGYNVFGQIFEGYDIAEKISNVAVDDSKKPTQDIVIEKIEIVKYN